MNEWNNITWYQQGWALPLIITCLVVAFAVSIIWFIDGIRKYGYWLHKENEEKKDSSDKKS